MPPTSSTNVDDVVSDLPRSVDGSCRTSRASSATLVTDRGDNVYESNCKGDGLA